MRMWISLFFIVVMVARISSMEIRQPLEPNPAILIQQSLPGSLELAAMLAPLKEEAQAIQKKIKAFNALMKQESWDEAVLKKVLEEYQELDEEVDVFPLRYQPLLSKARFGSRMDRGADQILGEHSALYSEVTFGLFKYMGVIFDIKKAYDAFKDVRSSLRSSQFPLCQCAVSDLQAYKKWSSSEYKGLQKYLNGTASFLLKKIKERNLYRDQEEESVQEKQKLEALDFDFEQQREEFSQNASCVEGILERQSFEEFDMQKLSDGYEHLVAIKKRLQLLREAALKTAVLGKEIGVLRDRLHKKSEKLHRDCSHIVATCDRLGVKDLKEIFTTFAHAEKALQQRAETKRVTERWFLASFREKWLLPQFPIYHVEHVSRLLIWDSESKPLQEAVRTQAKKYLQQIDQIANYSAAQKMILLIEEFYDYEKRMAAHLFSNDLMLRRDLQIFKDKIIRSTDVLELFKKFLVTKIDDFLRSAL